MENLAGLRLSIASQPLDRSTVLSDPFAQFRVWFDQANDADLFQANSMTLATTNADGRPSARMVLLESFDERGFRFYTSYASRKGKELDQNPWAALVFWWGPLFRQVRIEGTVSCLEESDCDRYFATRPRAHQLESRAFRQSQPIRDREELKRRVRMLKEKYRGKSIPRPDDFGGYRLKPVSLEFWQGRQDWLHDSLRYSRQAGGGWITERLAP